MSLTNIIANCLEMINRGEIPIVVCSACGNNSTYPRATCSRCGSHEISLKNSKGFGVLYAFTEIFRAPADMGNLTLPYTIAIIQLDEGIKIKGMLSGVEASSAKIGMRLRLSLPCQGRPTFVPA